MANGWVPKNRDWLGKRPPRKPRRKEEPPPEDENLPTVIISKTRCPHCHSDDTFVASSPKDSRIRYHKCRACGKPFKSVEE